jgi:hypothetical protein
MRARTWLGFSAIAAALAFSASVAAAQDAAKGRQYTPPFYVFSPDIAHDMITHDVGAIGLQPFADILAWDSFIALNWPVPSPIVQRGVPDRQNIIGGFLTSGGVGARINLFGYLIAEADFVKPFDRPEGWHWQFSFQPGF